MTTDVIASPDMVTLIVFVIGGSGGSRVVTETVTLIVVVLGTGSRVSTADVLDDALVCGTGSAPIQKDVPVASFPHVSGTDGFFESPGQFTAALDSPVGENPRNLAYPLQKVNQGDAVHGL